MKTQKSLIWSGYELTPEMREEIESLPNRTVNELREKFREVLGYTSLSRNRQFLVRKLTWGIQIRQWGDISEETRRRAYELADFRFLRVRMPRNMMAPPALDSQNVVRKKVQLSIDPRLPMPCATITKEHEGRELRVKVLDKGFEFEGKVYRSLSAIAKEVTGTNWNGYSWFGLGGAM